MMTDAQEICASGKKLEISIVWNDNPWNRSGSLKTQITKKAA
jgi:hypothetical protein